MKKETILYLPDKVQYRLGNILYMKKYTFRTLDFKRQFIAKICIIVARLAKTRQTEEKTLQDVAF